MAKTKSAIWSWDFEQMWLEVKCWKARQGIWAGIIFGPLKKPREIYTNSNLGDALHLSVRARLRFHVVQGGYEGDDQGQPAPDQGAQGTEEQDLVKDWKSYICLQVTSEDTNAALRANNQKYKFGKIKQLA